MLTPFFYYSIAISFCVSLFAEEALIILTTREYYGATDVIIVFSMLYGSYFFAKQPQLIYAKKTLLISFLSILNVAGNIALIPVFVKYWGFIGAAWATLFAGVIYVLVTFLLSQRYYSIRWEYAKIMTIFLLFFVGSVTTILLRHIIDIYILKLMVKLFLIGVYFLIGVHFKILTIELYNQFIKKILFKIKLY
jgi:O-antigen/teichoic acid export membrane protein